jgi:hypothetical protein
LRQTGVLVLYRGSHTSHVVVDLIETDWRSGVIPVEIHFPCGGSPG